MGVSVQIADKLELTSHRDSFIISMKVVANVAKTFKFNLFI